MAGTVSDGTISMRITILRRVIVVMITKTANKETKTGTTMAMMTAIRVTESTTTVKVVISMMMVKGTVGIPMAMMTATRITESMKTVKVVVSMMIVTGTIILSRAKAKIPAVAMVGDTISMAEAMVKGNVMKAWVTVMIRDMGKIMVKVTTMAMVTVTVMVTVMVTVTVTAMVTVMVMVMATVRMITSQTSVTARSLIEYVY